MLISIVGTRPNLIKLAPIAWEASKRKIDHYIIHTGQHYDYEMNQIFFEQLEIPIPSEFLNVGSGTDPFQIGETIKKVGDALKKISQPKFGLVYGDTNATVGGALGTRKSGLNLGHVESGIRSGNMNFPEELNRIISESCSNVLFPPTQSAYENVKSTNRAFLVGDVMHDALLWAQPKLMESLIQTYQLTSKEYILITLHRGKNVDERTRLAGILELLAKTNEYFIFPAHPRTNKSLQALDIPKNIQVIPPLGYISFLSLLTHAKKVVTDSGGVQKEAYSLGVPCVTLIDEPIWPETITAGWNRPTKITPLEIKKAIIDFWPTGNRPNIFGDGDAAKKILDLLEKKYKEELFS